MNQNKSSKRRFFIILLFGFGGLSILAALTTVDMSQNNHVTFAPLFQLLGKAPQSLSRSVTKILPVDSVDEGELGKNFKTYYSSSTALSADEQKSLDYLNSIIKRLQRFKKKPFDYQARILSSGSPNAMALPGGVIIVTTGLLKAVKSESELVAVLAHEMGHIELSHCFDSVKYEILSKKISLDSLGEIADFSRNLLVRHAFSKTQEDEADDYGFQLLIDSEYDPSAMSKAFFRLKEASSQPTDASPNPLRDYFLSHPPLDQRIAEFRTRAQLWWIIQNEVKRYIGVKNLKEKTDLSVKDFGDGEWTTVCTAP